MACSVCGNRGFLITNRSDGFMAVERCDTCGTCETDRLAALRANSGLGLRTIEIDGVQFITDLRGEKIGYLSGTKPGGNKTCQHHRIEALFKTDRTGLCDDCQVCGESRA